MFKLGVLIPVASVLFLGCVSSSKYEELKNEHDKLLLETEKKNMELDAERMRNKDLKKRNSAIKQENARIEMHLDTLNNEIAKTYQQMSGKQIQIEEEKARRLALKRELNEKNRALSKIKENNKKQKAVLSKYQGKFRRLIDSGLVDVKIEDGRLVVAMPSDVLFRSGSAQVGNDGYQTVTEVGEILTSLNGKRIQVEGHTDNVPIRGGLYRSNWHLGHARAMAVLRILINSGVPKSNISAASFSKFRPKADNSTPQGRKKNRRIEIVINPNIDEVLY